MVEMKIKWIKRFSTDQHSKSIGYIQIWKDWIDVNGIGFDPKVHTKEVIKEKQDELNLEMWE